MGDLISILLAVAAIAIDETLNGALGARFPTAVLALLPLPHLVAALARRALIAGRFAWGSALARVLAQLPLALHTTAVLLLGWHRSVMDALGVRGVADWPGPALLVSLAPYLVLSLLAIDARTRWLETHGSGLAAARTFRMRMLLSGVAPLAVYLCAMGAIGAIPRLRAEIEWVQLSGSAAALVLLAVFTLVLPRFLCATWDTLALEPGPARRIAEEVARRAGFRCREYRVWRTGGRMANAAVVGFLAWHRRVLFTDALLAQLGPRELAAVCAHEYGHALRRHVPTFAAAALGLVLSADVALALAAELDATAIAALAAALVLGGLASLGYLSRRFELDADLASIEILGDVEGLVAALEQAGGPTHARDRASWRHFSTDQRALFMRAAARDPQVGLRLRRSLSVFARGSVVLLVVASAGEILLQARGWSEERILVELALGDYGAARARARDCDGLSAETRALVARTALFPASMDGGREAIEPALIEQAARADLERGAVDAAREFLVLGALRGSADMRAASEALELAESGDVEGAVALAHAWAASWPLGEAIAELDRRAPATD